MEIREDYVSFETAKLLKEKGFDEMTELAYGLEHGHLRNDLPVSYWRNSEIGKYRFSCPTLQMACKWLREKYNIVISVNPQKDKYSFTPWQLRDSEWVFVKALLPLYDKHEAATEAAIKYCLENLI